MKYIEHSDWLLVRLHIRNNLDTVCWGQSNYSEMNQEEYDLTLLALWYRKGKLVEPEFVGLMTLKGYALKHVEDLIEVVKKSFTPPGER